MSLPRPLRLFMAFEAALAVGEGLWCAMRPSDVLQLLAHREVDGLTAMLGSSVGALALMGGLIMASALRLRDASAFRIVSTAILGGTILYLFALLNLADFVGAWNDALAIYVGTTAVFAVARLVAIISPRLAMAR